MHLSSRTWSNMDIVGLSGYASLPNYAPELWVNKEKVHRKVLDMITKTEMQIRHLCFHCSPKYLPD